MAKHTHGGRRPNQTGRPRHNNPKTEQAKARFTPAEIAHIEAARQSGESRAACIRRLVMEIIRMKEQKMTMYEFGTTDGLDASGTFIGIEVTESEYAANAQFNIDPQHEQHDGSGSRLAAIEVAADHTTVRLPEPGTLLVTTRPDLDSVGAMAALELRAEENQFDGYDIILTLPNQPSASRPEIEGRIKRVAAFDKFELSAPDAELIALNMYCQNGRTPLAERVQGIAKWLRSGKLPEGVQIQMDKLQADFDEANYDIGGTAYVCTISGTATSQAPFWIGYAKAPVVVFENPDSFGFRRLSIGVRPRFDYPLAALLEELKNREEGWGGNLASGIIGSPQKQDCTLPLEEVALMVGSQGF